MSSNFKIGLGFDSHGFQEGKKLFLGGVEIPFEFGFKAHSDGDLLIHSIIDAILGAAGKGNIGEKFPDTDDKYKNISSLKLLNQSYEFIRTEFEIINIDSTVIMEKPKIGTYIEQMKKNISNILKINKNNINIKGKTSEGMGFIGKGEGAAAFTVVLLEGIN